MYHIYKFPWLVIILVLWLACLGIGVIESSHFVSDYQLVELCCDL